MDGESSFSRLRVWWVNYRSILAGAAVLLALVLGIVGWARTDPSLSWEEILYRSLALFSLDFPYLVPSPALNVARFMAAVILYWTVGAVALRVAGRHRALRRASRAKGHVVVIGDGPEATTISRRFSRLSPRQRVVAVGETSEAEYVQLTRDGVVHLPAVSDHDLARIIRDTERVIVVGRSDDLAAGLARRVRGASATAIPTTVLFNDRDLAEQWSRAGREHVLCRPAQLSIPLLRDAPPFLEDAMVPPPIVLGGGPEATEIARRIVIGWQQPGERLTIHCVGHDRDWVDAALVGLEDRADFVWAPMAPRAGLVPRVVQELVGSWQRPAAKFRTSGPSIYVAYPDSAATVPIAMASAESMPDARVVCLVDDQDAWTGMATSVGRLFLASRDELLTDPATLRLDPARLLAAEIIADAGRWPADLPGVFGVVSRVEGRTARPQDQTATVQDGLHALAAATPSILATAGVRLELGGSSARSTLLLDPDQLTAVSEGILATLSDVPGLGMKTGEEIRHRSLELASRLPVLAARAGWVLVPPVGPTQPLEGARVTALAKAAHLGYLQVSRDSSNATGSENAGRTWGELAETEQRSNYAQVYDIPVKLAMVGLSWRGTDQPRPFAFPDDQIELLARWEHRRWMHFQLRNGRPAHQCNRPYDDLSEGEKDCDRAAVRAIPLALASAKLEIVPSLGGAAGVRVGEKGSPSGLT